MDIEDVAKTDPSAIKLHKIDVRKGLTAEGAAEVADSLKLTGKLREQAI